MTITHVVTINYTSSSSVLQYNTDGEPLVAFSYQNSQVNVGSRDAVSLTKSETIRALQSLISWDRLLKSNFNPTSFAMGMEDFNYVVRKTIPSSTHERLRGIFAVNDSSLTDMLFRENLNRSDFEARPATVLSYSPEWTLWMNFYQNIIDQLNLIS